MGKNLLQQRRGRGTIRFRAQRHRYYGKINYGKMGTELRGRVEDIVHCPAHSSPLMTIQYENGESALIPANENAKVGAEISCGENSKIEGGNVLPLNKIPEGTLIFNIESQPGDGGKFVRSSGTCARVVAKSNDAVKIELPSKKEKDFNPMCRATIGRISGAGRLDKPITKAGNAFYKMTARNRVWPHVCGQSMNAVAHPHGGKRSSHKNYPMVVSRHTPPGAKVGKIAARRTGRKNR